MTIDRSRLIIWLRRFVLVILAVFTCLCQSAVPLPGNTGVFLLLPFTVCVSMYEKEFAGMLFGAFAGALWDCSGAFTDGIYAFFMALAACIIGFLCHYLLRNTFLIAFLLNLILTALFCLSVWVQAIWSCPTVWRELITQSLFPSFLATAAVLPLFYFPVKALEKKWKKKEYGV